MKTSRDYEEIMRHIANGDLAAVHQVVKKRDERGIPLIDLNNNFNLSYFFREATFINSNALVFALRCPQVNIDICNYLLTIRDHQGNVVIDLNYVFKGRGTVIYYLLKSNLDLVSKRVLLQSLIDIKGARGELLFKLRAYITTEGRFGLLRCALVLRDVEILKILLAAQDQDGAISLNVNQIYTDQKTLLDVAYFFNEVADHSGVHDLRIPEDIIRLIKNAGGLRRIELEPIAIKAPVATIDPLPIRETQRLSDYQYPVFQANVNRGPGPKSLEAREIFLGEGVPPVNYYRLHVLNRVIEENGKVYIRQVIDDSIGAIRDISYFDNLVQMVNEGDLRYVEVPMRIGLAWQPLPSLTPYDEITAIGLKGDFEVLGPVAATNCCYIRSKTQEVNVKLRMNLQQNRALQLNQKQSLPTTKQAEKFIRSICFNPNQASFEIPTGISQADLIGAIVNFLREFHEIDPANADDQNFARALNNAKNDYEVFNLRLFYQVGICCDVVTLFMMFAQRLNLTARYIRNDAHDFIEYCIDGQWHQACLGGGTSAELKIRKIEPFTLSRPHLGSRYSFLERMDTLKLIDKSSNKAVREAYLTVIKAIQESKGLKFDDAELLLKSFIEKAALDLTEKDFKNNNSSDPGFNQ